MIITGYGNYIGLGVLPSFSKSLFSPTPAPTPAPSPTPSVVKLAPSAMYPSTPYIGPLATPSQFSPSVFASLPQAPPSMVQAVPSAFPPQPTSMVVAGYQQAGQPWQQLYSPQYMFPPLVPGGPCPPGSMAGKYPDTCIPVGNPNVPQVPQGQTVVKTSVNVSTPSTKAAEQAKTDYDQLLPVDVGPSGTVVATPNKSAMPLLAAGAALLLLGFLK
jgi:hypothetical protein